MSIKGSYKMWALEFLQKRLSETQLKAINDKIKELEQKNAKQKPEKPEEVKPIDPGEAQSQPAEIK